MKKYLIRSIAAIAAGLSMTSCLDPKKTYDHTGYHPIQGLPYAGDSVGGCINARDIAGGKLVTAFGVEDTGRIVYSGGYDGEGAGAQFTRQLPLRLGASYGDVTVRDVGASPDNQCVAVGSGGSLFAFGGPECFEAIDPPTEEDLNTVIFSPILGTWIAAGNNGSVFRSDDRVNWSSVFVGSLPENTHFFDSINYAQGTLLVSDDRIAELTEADGGGIGVSYRIGIGKNFKAVAKWKEHYLAFAEDENSGGSVVLERTAVPPPGKDFDFNFAPEFGSIFSNSYRTFYTSGDFAYFFRKDEDTVEIRNYNDSNDVTTRTLPGKVEEFLPLEDRVYLSLKHSWGGRMLWRANLDYSLTTPVTNEPDDTEVKAGECLDAGSGPTWSLYGSDYDADTSGLQYLRYQGSDKSTHTIEGTSGTGTVCATARPSSKLGLGVGYLGSDPLLFADFGLKSFALSGAGLEGRLSGISYNHSSSTGLITNEAGDVFTADLSGAETKAALDAVSWNKETLPWKVQASFTFGEGTFYGKIREDEGSEDQVAFRSAAGDWSSLKLDFGTRLNDLYYSNRFSTLFAATDEGLGYRMSDDQQGLFPLNVAQKTNVEFHQIVGDGRGEKFAFIAGIPGDLDGPCMTGELDFGGFLSPNPSVEVIDYTAPQRNPTLIESGGFFGLLGNRGLASLYPQRFCEWDDYAEAFFGDRNLDPDGDLDSNGISNYEQAVGGRNGLQSTITRDGNGFARITIPVNPFLQDYKFQPESSSTLRDFEPHNPFLYFPSATGGLEITEPIKSTGEDRSDYFSVRIQRTF